MLKILCFIKHNIIYNLRFSQIIPFRKSDKHCGKSRERGDYITKINGTSQMGNPPLGEGFFDPMVASCQLLHTVAEFVSCKA